MLNERGRLDLSWVGCASGTTGEVSGFALLPTAGLTTDRWSSDDLCDGLPPAAVGTGGGGGGGGAVREAFQKCTDDLSAMGQGPVLGPETISTLGPIGKALVDAGAAVAVEAAVSAFGQLTGPEKVALGTAMAFMVGPTLIILSTLGAAGGVAATATLAVGVAVMGTGAATTGAGIQQGVTPSPSPKPGSSGQPDSEASTMPQSCGDALGVMAACLGRQQCETDLAKEMEAIRQQARQSDKVLVDPDGEYCSGAGADPDEFAAALVAMCKAYWQDKRPDPGAPAVCPLLAGAAGAGGLRDPISRICLQVAGDDGFQCPDLPAEPGPGGGGIPGPVPIPFPSCPPGSNPADCTPPGRG